MQVRAQVITTCIKDKYNDVIVRNIVNSNCYLYNYSLYSVRAETSSWVTARFIVLGEQSVAGSSEHKEHTSTQTVFFNWLFLWRI